MPDPSISYIWQITGCQHSLNQPTDDDFGAPTVPALTPRGFSRWESVEILLGPEEHVPFMQYAVQNWNLKHPETGEVFPVELPREVFPRVPDADVDLWHQNCGRRMAQEAAREKDETERRARSSEPSDYRRDRPSQTSTPQGRHRPDDSDYFGRNAAYTNIPERRASRKDQRHSKSPERPSRRTSSAERARRRSFSDFNVSSPPPAEERPKPAAYDPEYLDPEQRRKPSTARRHSHPRRNSTSEDEVPQRQDSRRRPRGTSPPIPTIRRPAASGNGRPSRADLRAEELRKSSSGSGLSPLGSIRNKLSEKVSSIFPNPLASSHPKPPPSRQHASSEYLRERRNRDLPPSRLSRSHSDLDTDDDLVDDPTEEARRQRNKRPDDRPRDRDRYGGRSDRERDSDRDSRRDRQHLRRPSPTRRTSSHADVDRRREAGLGPGEMSYRDRMKEQRRWDRRPSVEDQMDLGSDGLPTANRRHPEPNYA